MRARPFMQVDVFTGTPYFGNPVGVVLDATGVDDDEMQRVAAWANLSETTFVFPPTTAAADYRVRIFTTANELPFAGHPTLGTAHAWLAHSGDNKEALTQQCAAGLVRVRKGKGGLAFAAPPMVRSGPVEEALVDRLARSLNVDRADVVDAQWVDNGPGWVALMLKDASSVLALRPGPVEGPVGVVGAYPPGDGPAYEVRAFLPNDGGTTEDPVTGSLNASLAEWLTSTGRFEPPYVASQGAARGRKGLAYIEQDEDGTIWVGGGTVTCIEGHVRI
ncbi:MAG TPA: PhzF family phenazine biosynthesis protein [Acidimicrobiales bacterium]|nr:PhzF family phenazine biosynthesis protein [Acidimicrobiales bacterium]